MKIILIDYSGLLINEEEQDVDSEMPSIFRGLKHIAKELGITIIVTSQMDRSTSLTDRIPILPQSDRFFNLKCLQYVDTHVVLYRPSLFKQSSQNSDARDQAIVVKHPSQSQFIIPLKFDSQNVSFGFEWKSINVYH